MLSASPQNKSENDKLMMAIHGDDHEDDKQFILRLFDDTYENAATTNDSSSSDGVHIQVYNAIQLTNYYTNLLFNKQHQQRQQQCDQQSKQPPAGSSWRSKQLALQIPQQDIKLLAAASNTPAEVSRIAPQHKPDMGVQVSGQGADEIKFIRDQRKAASQFKASLYYLNPVQAQKQRNTTSWLRGGASSQSQRSKNGPVQQQQQHSCFKVSLMTPNSQVLTCGFSLPCCGALKTKVNCQI